MPRLRIFTIVEIDEYWLPQAPLVSVPIAENNFAFVENPRKFL